MKTTKKRHGEMLRVDEADGNKKKKRKILRFFFSKISKIDIIFMQSNLHELFLY